MEDDIDRILVTRAQIATRIEELARQITVDHTTAEGETEITLVPILTGAIVLAADLMRHMPVRMKIGLMTVRSARRVRASWEASSAIFAAGTSCCWTIFSIAAAPSGWSCLCSRKWARRA